MVLKKDKKLKLYYSIGEVAKIFDVNESTLRYWEKEFDIIRPRKTDGGARLYKQGDIDCVRLVYHLLKERGMTIAGAKQKLKDNRETTVDRAEVVHRLQEIRKELLGIREAFDRLLPGD